MGANGGYGGPGMDVKSFGGRGVPEMVEKGFRWVWRARYGCEGLQRDVEGLRWMRRALIGCVGLEMVMNRNWWVWRA